MYFEKSLFSDLEKVCIEKYDDDKGKEIYNKGEEYFKKFLDEADFRNSDMIKYHMTFNIFPALAYYMALLDTGFDKEQSYNNVLEQTQRYANVWKEQYKKLGKMPFGYSLFKMGVKKVMAKNYPPEGWETEWVILNNKEIHFNLKSCVYFDTVFKYGHPELCTVFCKNDVTSFSGLMPNIRFERSGSIGSGHELCDFHYLKNK